MSSRSYAQKSARSKFFLSSTDTYSNWVAGIVTPADFETALKDVTVPYTVNGNLYSTTNFYDMVTLYSNVYYYTGNLPKGILLKDLGKTIEFKVDGSLFARWNLVQAVNGPMTEGVSALEADTFYVTTFLCIPNQNILYEIIGVARVG